MKYTFIMLLWCITIMAKAQPPNNPIFGGGSADGIDKVSFAQASNNIFNGGNADGWSFNSFAQANTNIFNGGDADGWSFTNFSQSSTNIFNGGNGDGWSFINFSQVANNIFKGGDGDGWSFINFAQAGNNIFFGGGGDGWSSTYRPVGPLPISILSFTAEKINETALLNWEVTAAFDFSHFEVERSTNAINFSPLGIVQGTTAATYHFTDTKPVTGYNYYRLKLVDKDGRYKYTPVRSLYFGGRASCISVYPNPVTTFTNVSLSAAMQSENLVLNLISSNGQVVFHQKIGANTTAVVNLNMSALPAGTYFLHLKGTSSNETATLIKQ